MSRNNTGNPIDSGSLKDLEDNAKNLDQAVNDPDNDTFIDRFGTERKTWSGIERQAQVDIGSAAAEAAEIAAAEATAQAGEYRDEARDERVAAETAREEAQQARDDAVAVVYSGDASLTPAPGKIPVAGADGTIDLGWMKTGHPNLRPTLLMDFVNGQTLDPRMAYTSASPQEYFGGEMVVAEQNLFHSPPSALMLPLTGGVIGGAVNNGDYTATLSGPSQYAIRVVGTQRPAGHAYSVKAKVSGTGVVRLMGLTGGGSPIATDIQTITLTSTPVEYFWAGVSQTAGVNCGICVRGAEDGSTATVKVEDIQFRNDHLNVAYVPTTTAPITRYQPKLSVALPNVPFFQINPITGVAEGLGTRAMVTNLVTNTDYGYANTAPSALSGLDVVGTGIGLLGTNTAQVLKAIAAVSAKRFVGFHIGGLTGTHTYKTVLKKISAANMSLIAILYSGSTTNGNSSTTIPINGPGSGVGTGSIQKWELKDIGNGRLELRLVYTAGPDQSRLMFFVNSTTSYAGNGETLQVSDCMLCAGDVDPVYFRTGSSQETRTAAVPTMPLGRWFNPSEGTLVFEGSSVANAGAVQIDDGTTNNRIYLTSRPAGSAGTVAGIIAGGAAQADLGNTVWQSKNKLAISYKRDDIKASGNGGTVATDPSAIIPAGLTTLRFMSNSVNQVTGNVGKFAYYPKAVSASELEALTK